MNCVILVYILCNLVSRRDKESESSTIPCHVLVYSLSNPCIYGLFYTSSHANFHYLPYQFMQAEFACASSSVYIECTH